MYSPIAAVAIQIMQYDIALASSLYDGMREVVANNPHRNDADQRGFASCIAHGPNRFTFQNGIRSARLHSGPHI
jgi:hypothetical protein